MLAQVIMANKMKNLGEMLIDSKQFLSTSEEIAIQKFTFYELVLHCINLDHLYNGMRTLCRMSGGYHNNNKQFLRWRHMKYQDFESFRE